MAFVFKSESPDLLKKANPELGPGSYLSHVDYKVGKNKIPFLSSVKKDTELKYGDDQINFLDNGKKISHNAMLHSKPPNKPELSVYAATTLSNKMENLLNLKSYQKKKEPTSHFFKSTSERFSLKKGLAPGPGSYVKNEDFENLKIMGPNFGFGGGMEEKEKKSLVNDILKFNNYQPVPSIPSNFHELGYRDDEETHSIKLNKHGSEYYTGLGNDKPGPGQYNLKGALELSRNQGYSWSKSKAQKKAADPEKLGPGCYNINYNTLPLYKYKSSSSFSSNIGRHLFEKKSKTGENTKQILLQKIKNKMQSFESTESNENNLTSFAELYNEGVNLGPGSYFDPAKTSSFKIGGKPVEQQNFGSSSIRFKKGNESTSTGLGPGNYDSTMSEAKSVMKSKINVPFGSGNDRFDMKLNNNVPGPGSYISKLNILKNKIITTNPSANFGGTDLRFKGDKENESKPGPGAYIEVLKKNYKNRNKHNFYFKSETDRTIFPKNENPGSGTYQVEDKTIEKTLKDKLEKDEDVLKKKPAFSSSLSRFTDLPKEVPVEEEEFNSPIHSIQDKIFSEKKGDKPRETAARFVYKPKDEIPGPGKYFNLDDGSWNKKTFNVIFADV